MQKKPVSFIRSASLTIGIFVALVLSFAIYSRAQQQLWQAIESRKTAQLLADELRQSTDDLSKLARAFVATGETRFRTYHQAILDIRDGHLARPADYQSAYWDFVVARKLTFSAQPGQGVAWLQLLRDAGLTPQELAQLEQAKNQSDSLAQREKQAMTMVMRPAAYGGLVAARIQASALLNDATYHQAKVTVVEPISAFYALLDQRAQTAISRAERVVWLLRFFMVAFGVTLMFRIYRVNHYLRTTLGGSISQVHDLISRMGQGACMPDDLPPVQSENSVMGWLVKTQHKLNELDQARQHAEAALRENEARYRTMVEGAAEPIMVHRDGALVYLNPSALRVLGAQTAQDFLGKSLYKLVHPHYHGISRERSRLLLNSGQSVPAAELQFIRLDGRVIDVEAQSAVVMLDGLKSIQVSWRDITERKKLEEQVRKLAFYDALTSLPNRRLLDDRLHRTLLTHKRTHACGALMFLDLDNFKPLNDTHGHVVGDLLLVEVANRLRACVREVDTVARFGGDEFVVLLGDLSPELNKAASHAHNVAEKIRASLSEPYHLNYTGEQDNPVTVEHRCTVSIGGAIFTHEQVSAGEVLKQADAAMYRAKEAGRNAIYFSE